MLNNVKDVVDYESADEHYQERPLVVSFAFFCLTMLSFEKIVYLKCFMVFRILFLILKHIFTHLSQRKLGLHIFRCEPKLLKI